MFVLYYLIVIVACSALDITFYNDIRFDSKGNPRTNIGGWEGEEGAGRPVFFAPTRFHTPAAFGAAKTLEDDVDGMSAVAARRSGSSSSSSSSASSSAAAAAAAAGAVPGTSGPGANVEVRPQFVDFGEVMISGCQPASANITIFNRATDDELIVHSVTTDTLNFMHNMEGVRNMLIRPEGAVNITVLFAPRATHRVNATLRVHTNVGAFFVPIRATAMPCTYRLGHMSLVVGNSGQAHAPLYLYNPHPDPLRVIRISSYAKFLSILVPSATNASAGIAGATPNPTGPTTIVSRDHPWVIPGNKRALIAYIQASALSTPGRYRAPITIQSGRGFFIVPVDVLVLKNTNGVYFNMRDSGVVDFGTLTTPHASVTVPVPLLAQGTKPVALLDVYPASPDASLSVSFVRRSIIPDATNSTAAEMQGIWYSSSASSHFSSPSSSSFGAAAAAAGSAAAAASGAASGSSSASASSGSSASASSASAFAGTPDYLEDPSGSSFGSSSSGGGGSLMGGGYSAIVTVTFRALTEGQFSGKLIFQTNSSNAAYSFLEIPYSAYVKYGSLVSSTINTTFPVSPSVPYAPVVRMLYLRNYFREALTVFSTHIDDANFSVSSLPPKTVLKQGDTMPPLTITYVPQSTGQLYQVDLVILTNISALYIPLHVYHGQLQYSVLDSIDPLTTSDPDMLSSSILRAPAGPGSSTHARRARGAAAGGAPGSALGSAGGSAAGAAGSLRAIANRIDGTTALNAASRLSHPSKLDFGTVAVNEVRTLYLNLTNPNPVRIHILEYNSTSPTTVVVSLESSFSRDSALSGHGSSSSSTGSAASGGPSGPGSSRPPSASASGSSSSQDSWDSGFPRSPGGPEPLFSLEPGQSAVFAVTSTSSREGKFKEEVIFTTSHEELRVPVRYRAMSGTFAMSPSLVKFDASFPGRTVRSPIMAISTFSQPLKITDITSTDRRFIPVVTNATLYPNQKSSIGYIVFDPSLSDPEDNFLLPVPEKSFYSSQSISDDDRKLIAERESSWEEMVARGKVDIRARLDIDTDVIKSYSLHVRGALTQPVIVKKEGLDFGIGQIGSTIAKFISVSNPSDHPLFVQLVPEQLPSNETFAHFLASGRMIFDVTQSDGRSIYAPLLATASPTGGPLKLPFRIDQRSTNGFLIAPHSEARVGPINFSPVSLEKVSAVLHIKNNLTVVTDVLIKGEGGSGKLLFHDGTEFVKTVNFHLNSSYLGFEEHPRGSGQYRQKPGSRKDMISTRTLRAVNKGNMPVQVYQFDVDGHGCSGFGFNIERCKPFSLQPEEEIAWSVQYRPDFYATVVRHPLHIVTSQGLITFSLEARIPLPLVVAWVNNQPLTASEAFARKFASLSVVFISTLALACVVGVRFFVSTPTGTAVATNASSSGKKHSGAHSTKQAAAAAATATAAAASSAPVVDVAQIPLTSASADSDEHSRSRGSSFDHQAAGAPSSAAAASETSSKAAKSASGGTKERSSSDVAKLASDDGTGSGKAKKKNSQQQQQQQQQQQPQQAAAPAAPAKDSSAASSSSAAPAGKEANGKKKKDSTSSSQPSAAATTTTATANGSSKPRSDSNVSADEPNGAAPARKLSSSSKVGSMDHIRSSSSSQEQLASLQQQQQQQQQQRDTNANAAASSSSVRNSPMIALTVEPTPRQQTVLEPIGHKSPKVKNKDLPGADAAGIKAQKQMQHNVAHGKNAHHAGAGSSASSVHNSVAAAQQAAPASDSWSTGSVSIPAMGPRANEPLISSVAGVDLGSGAPAAGSSLLGGFGAYGFTGASPLDPVAPWGVAGASAFGSSLWTPASIPQPAPVPDSAPVATAGSAPAFGSTLFSSLNTGGESSLFSDFGAFWSDLSSTAAANNNNNNNTSNNNNNSNNSNNTAHSSAHSENAAQSNRFGGAGSRGARGGRGGGNGQQQTNHNNSNNQRGGRGGGNVGAHGSRGGADRSASSGGRHQNNNNNNNQMGSPPPGLSLAGVGAPPGLSLGGFGRSNHAGGGRASDLLEPLEPEYGSGSGGGGGGGGHSKSHHGGVGDVGQGEVITPQMEAKFNEMMNNFYVARG